MTCGHHGAQEYEFWIRGHLGQTTRHAFPDLRARVHGADTVLHGVVADQAALHGVLAEIEALGLELLEVRRLPPGRLPPSGTPEAKS
jgi:hypothetical protein